MEIKAEEDDLLNHLHRAIVHCDSSQIPMPVASEISFLIEYF